MSVVKLKVYSKKWQSPLEVTAVSVFGLFKEFFEMKRCAVGVGRRKI